MRGAALAGIPGEWTSFVGRQAEITEVRRLLGVGRVVTLTGPGGVGKTRLAVHVMPLLAADFGDGAVFVGLAELRDGELLANLVADRLGLQDRSGRTAQQAVLEFLRGRQLLLVLDNCEHLVDACADFVQAVVSSCPRVVVLATSRQSLGIAGERLLPVAPLVVLSDAVALFVDRAAAVTPGFERTASNEADLVRIAERVDGLPLGIELAAALTRSLSPAQLADRLDSQLTVLTRGRRSAPERQQTFRATLDWSYELCTPAERAVWCRASVFAGTFDLDAAVYVCAEPDVGEDVLDVIDALLDKSVLLREDGAERVRYRLLEPLREYGHERLAADGDEERVARRHRDWFDRLTATADAEWIGPNQVEWVARLRADHANIRAALGWSIAQPGEAGVALRMASRLDEYWGYVLGLNAEAQLWLDRALAATPADHPDRGLALVVSAVYALWLAKLEDAEQRLNTAAEIAARTRDEVLDAHIANARAFRLMQLNRPGTSALAASAAAAFRKHRELQPLFLRGMAVIRAFRSMPWFKPGAAALAASAAAVFRKHGLVRQELQPLYIHAIGSALEGDPDTARHTLHRMIALTEPSGELFNRSGAYGGLAVVELVFGNPGTAADAAITALRTGREIGARMNTAGQIEFLAWIADEQRDHHRAATLFGAAATMWDLAGASPVVNVTIAHRLHLDSTRAILGDAVFDAAFRDGRAMSEDEAIRYALDEDKPTEAAPPPSNPLTRRESEIADLVTEGLTNAQIAEKLFISPRTAETHVQHILTKLGFTNRAQIASWIADQRDGSQ